MSNPMQHLIDAAPASNYEEDDYNAGYLAGLIDAQKAITRFAVVELPEGEQDDDGQTWFDDCEIRVDHTGRHGAEVYLNKRPVHQIGRAHV